MPHSRIPDVRISVAYEGSSHGDYVLVVGVFAVLNLLYLWNYSSDNSSGWSIHWCCGGVLSRHVNSYCM